MDDNEKIIKNSIEAEEKNRRALRHLLAQQREKDGHLLALCLSMGKTRSYLVSASLNWVAANVKFAADIPLFQPNSDGERADQSTKQIFINEGTIDAVQQRSPDWRRQLLMSIYLATRPSRKFPPLLIVGYQGWVYQENAEQWGPDMRAMADSVMTVPLDNKGNYCDLDSKNTLYYAIDGQHRLMAIKGLKELIETKQLMSLGKNRKPLNTVITWDEVIDVICRETNEKRHVVDERMQMAMINEHIGIEVVPAVMDGETYREALMRLRTIFVDVNENAKKPSRGESILLDESNGFRIVARRVMVKHALLKGKVEYQAGSINEKSSCYTTLTALAKIAEAYLGSDFSKWKDRIFGNNKLGFIRPEESELDEATEKLSSYFDLLSSLPSHARLLGGTDAKIIRGEEGEKAEDNILFRPIAQVAFAEAVSILVRKREKSLDSIFLCLKKQEEFGQLKLHDKRAPWLGVLCEIADGRMRRKKENEDMCRRLMVYLFGGENDDGEREKLRKRFATMRAVGEDEAYSSDGKMVKKEEVQLPDVW